MLGVHWSHPAHCKEVSAIPPSPPTLRFPFVRMLQMDLSRAGLFHYSFLDMVIIALKTLAAFSFPIYHFFFSVV